MQLSVIRNPWMKIRSAVSAVDNPLLGVSTKNWGNRGSTIGRDIPVGANGISVAVMGDDDGSDVTATIYVYDDRGPAQWVAGVTWKIGAMNVIEDPTEASSPVSTLKYGDTITVVDQGWPNKFFNLLDDEGDDGIAQVAFVTLGAKWISFEVSALDGGLIVTPIFKIWT